MTKAVFFGASSVEGVGASAPDKRFSTIASRIMGWDEVNLGLSGTCVTGRDAEGQVLDEDSGLGRVPDVLDAQPALVFVLHGANDFVQNVPIGDPAQFRQGTFLWDYDTMARGLLFELQPAQVVLMTVFDRQDAQSPNAAGLTLADYNAMVRTVGARYNLRVLDTFADAGLDFATDYAPDGVHPNDNGHQCLAAFIVQAMQAQPAPSVSA